MAVRDVKNFKFLSEAIVQRFRDPSLKSFRGIPYEPQTNPRSIFGQVYSTFREMIGKGLNLHQYLNIGERSVLENLYRNLQSDINLKFLNNPDSILNDPRFELPDQYYLEQSPEMIAAEQLEAVPTQAPAGAPVSTIPGGMRLPPAPRIPFGSRHVYNVPHAPEPPPPKSELVTANKSGVIQEAPSGAKLVAASSSGVIKEAPPKQIFIANKQGIVTGVQNIKPPSWLKTFGSNAQIFAKRNLGKVFDGLKGIGGGLGRGIAGGIGGGLGAAAPALGRMGNGVLSGLEQVTKPGGGQGGISSITKIGNNRGKWVFILMLVGVMILTTLIGVLPGSAPPGQAGPLPPVGGGCPDTSGNRNPATCRYLNPSINLFDTNISQTAIDSYVNKYSPIFINAGKGDINEFKRRVDYIVSNAKTAGLNPAIFLGYWKTESMFSTSTNTTRDMGCAGGDDFYNQVDCALGINAFTNPNTNPIANCAKSKDAGSAACQALKGIRAKAYDKTHPISYPIATFDNFAEAYGPYDDLTGGQPTNCTHTYNELIDTAKELGVCQAVPPGGGSDFASQLVDKIKKSISCSGYVTIFNLDVCIPSIRPIPDLTERALNTSVLTPGNQGVLQCVGFVKAVATDLINQPGNAIDYASPNIPGYNYFPRAGNQIQVGDLPVWKVAPGRPYGHIASVVSVGKDGTFQVAEANFCIQPCGKVDNLRYDDYINDDQIAGWLRKK